MDSATWVALASSATAVLTASFALIRNIRKDDRSSDNEELALQIQSWRNIVGDQQSQIEANKAESKEMRTEIRELRAEVKQCHEDRDELIFKIHRLERVVLNLGRKDDQ